MKSTWVAAGLLLVTICQAEENPVPSSTAIPTLPTPLPMTMESINEENGSYFQICFKNQVPTTDSGTTKYEAILDSPTGGENTIFGTIAKSDNKCLQFPGIINDWPTEGLFIIVQVLDDNDIPTHYSSATLDTIPDFPDLTTSHGDDPMSTGNIVWRIEGDLLQMELSILPHVYKKNISYYIAFEYTDDINLRPCIDGAPKVCGIKLLKGDKAVDSGPTASIATLSYINAITAQLKSDVHSSLTVPLASDQLEVIVATHSSGDLDLCIADANTDCQIAWNGPGNDVANLRVIGVSTLSQTMEEIKKHQIHDRELQHTLLGVDILEGRWLILSDDDKIYTLTLSSNEPTLSVEADCSDVTIKHCFGYFPGVSKTSYTITVQKKTDGNMEQVQSESIPKSKPPKHKDLQIHVLPMKWHQNLMEVNTTICFNHETPNEEMIFSHYEMLLINTRGQWLKHKVMEEDDNDDVLCFTPFTINTQELDVTEGVKVVVSQRASDGFSVIASGGSPLFYT